MKNKIKRILSLMLAFVLIWSVCSIDVTLAASNEREPNDSRATATLINEFQTAGTLSSFDTDWFRLVADSSGYFTIRVDASNYGASIGLYNSSGSQLRSASFSANSYGQINAVIVYMSTSRGSSYYLKVASNTSSYISYSIAAAGIDTTVVEHTHSYTNSCDTTCNGCGATRTISHTYSSNCDTACNVCGVSRSTSAQHTYSGGCDTTCNGCSATRTASSSHTYTNSCDTSCNVCGKTRTIRHTYSNSCDTSCNVCGVTRSIAHTYSNSCDTSCNACGVTRSIAHTYSNSCDTSCNVCGVTRNVNNHIYSYSCDSSCNTCGYIRNSVVHKTILKNQKAATTTSTGYTGDTVCSVCNAIVKKGSTIAKITYTVSAKNVELSFTSCTYDGYEWEPIEFVYDNFGNLLSWNKDYTVTYKNNKYPGKGSVIIKFKGNYTGTIVKTFTIKPKKVTQNSLKSSKKKQMKISWKKATKVSGYEIVYATNSKFTKGKKTIKVTSSKTTSKTIKKLKSKKIYYVKVRAYKTVSGKKTYGTYSKIKKIKIK